MRIEMTKLTVLLLPMAFASVASGQQIQVTIENAQPQADGFYFTPVWLAFHDGGYELFDSGATASAGLELIAETGAPDGLDMELDSTTNADTTARYSALVTSPAGFAGAPVFDPGEVVTRMLNIPDAASNRYLTFASMVIPSNDAFLGNGNPLQYTVFNDDGSFAGPLTIEITGNHIYDAGTEVNDAMGAAFSALGGMDSVENGTVGLHGGLDNFVGTETADMTTIGTVIGADEVIARIQIHAVPEPSAIALLLMAWLGLIRLARRRA